MDLRRRRLTRGWSQEQLAEVSGLSVRTIQRLENGGQAGLASLAALRRVFGADVDQVISDDPAASPPESFVEAVRTCLSRFDHFSGRAGRAEYWWFLLFVALTTSAAALIHEVLGGVILLAWVLPLVAAGTRRLRDAGHSPWWQLLFVVPFGGVVTLILLASPPHPARHPEAPPVGPTRAPGADDS